MDTRQTIERSERLVAAQGLDHLVLRTCTSGRARIEGDGPPSEAGPGDLVVLDLARPVRIETEPASAVSIVLPRRVLRAGASDVPVAHGRVMVGDQAPMARLLAGHLSHLADCLPAPPPLAAHLVPATLALCRGLLATGQGGDGIPEAMDVGVGIAIRRFVEANLATIDVPTLTARFGLSRTQLYRRFGGADGIAAHIRDRRLAEAMRRLTRAPGGHRPMLARLSHEVGFADPRVFSRAFHRKYGLWPAEVPATRWASDTTAVGTPPMAWLREL